MAVKVTFDKNVYEFVVDPEKAGSISDDLRFYYRQINSWIDGGKIIPFISETILTYEVLSKESRKSVLSHLQPIVVTSDNNSITISSNPEIHPGNTFYDDIYLPKAILAGFKILPDRRFGKLINPSVKSEWYYLPDEDYFVTGEKFSAVLRVLEDLNVGYKAYQNILGGEEIRHSKPFEAVQQFAGTTKKLSAALSERSDGDSVALHIANELDYFCTFDQGLSTKQSVFNEKICKLLFEKFSFKKLTPIELCAIDRML